MTTHLLKPRFVFSDSRTRCGKSASEADADDMIAMESDIEEVDCPGCLRDVIAELRKAHAARP